MISQAAGNNNKNNNNSLRTPVLPSQHSELLFRKPHSYLRSPHPPWRQHRPNLSRVSKKRTLEEIDAEEEEIEREAERLVWEQERLAARRKQLREERMQVYRG